MILYQLACRGTQINLTQISGKVNRTSDLARFDTGAGGSNAAILPQAPGPSYHGPELFDLDQKPLAHLFRSLGPRA